ncbi:alpha/beta fold hydrolase [Bacillus sp. REN10]|uniref:alpha/beta fold hydrolase n=1 Tax=Bacillus sp. REN10 TaxID=2782541 RepID=UPI00193BCACC|nr:alpha/beta fold hydrolase [Bacillus sp. REN10]
MQQLRKNNIIVLLIVLSFASYYLHEYTKAATSPHSNVTVFIHGYKGTVNSFRSMLHRFEHEHHWGRQVLLCKVTKDGRVLTSKVQRYTTNDRLFVQVVFENNRASFKDTAYWLSKVMNTLKAQYGINEVNLVGHSMGGIVSTKFLEDYQQGSKYPHVNKLVVIGSPFKGVKNEKYFQTNKGGAALDLMPSSPAVTQLEKNKDAFPRHVKTLTIAGVADQVVDIDSALAIKHIVPKDNYHEVIIFDPNINHSGLHESNEVDERIGQFLWNEK